MNVHSERFTMSGPAGALDVLRDEPAPGLLRRGTAVIAHPHPLYGGTMENKVVQTLARAFVQSGWTAVRFNFRGVAGSAGTYDEGVGERQDMEAVVAALGGDGALCLAGFSFGAFVASHVAAASWPTRPFERLVLVGAATSRFDVAPLPPESHERTLVVHGESDDTVPLASVLDWARPQSLPVTVVPGGEHFFHGQLPLLKSLMVRHLR
ncbi:alpha/beta family hydrolase [Ramlibacter sp. AN1015]|uniref:alpha/beta hydrolase n=1 Tax=Ramlibacter sp. AN1015 TaxID=3133428 RepID=UPI0030C0A1AF